MRNGTPGHYREKHDLRLATRALKKVGVQTRTNDESKTHRLTQAPSRNTGRWVELHLWSKPWLWSAEKYLTHTCSKFSSTIENRMHKHPSDKGCALQVSVQSKPQQILLPLLRNPELTSHGDSAYVVFGDVCTVCGATAPNITGPGLFYWFGSKPPPYVRSEHSPPPSRV